MATSTVSPSSSNNQRRPFIVDGLTVDAAQARAVNYRAVSAGFFDVLRIPIQDGRGIGPHDGDGTELVAVVSRSLAEAYWPEASPLGKRVKFDKDDTEWATVVGVSGNVLDDWFMSRNAPTVYVPVLQRPSTQVNILARGSGVVADQLSGLRAAIARVDAALPAYDTKTMGEVIHLRTSGLRMISQLMAAFGLLALLLSAAGIYSVMAHSVAQRRHEIGVRMAFGATTRDVLNLTVGQGLKLAGLGIVIGLAMAFGLARVIESALSGVVAVEPALFVAITAVLTMVALMATLLPARHAAAVDPASALRGGS
ncbi:MAG: ABC transporter permease [Acidobacteria bacterium]|nr:ABC transporter permease [Acidobacteriota bacterium]